MGIDLTPIVGIAIQELPSIIGYLKDAFRSSNPSAPVPTDADVLTAYRAALDSSEAKDEQWLAAHPES